MRLAWHVRSAFVVAVVSAAAAASSAAGVVELAPNDRPPSSCSDGQAAVATGEGSAWRCRGDVWVPAGVPLCDDPDPLGRACVDGSTCWNASERGIDRCVAGKWAALAMSPEAVSLLSTPEIVVEGKPTMGRRGKATVIVSPARTRYVARSKSGRLLYKGKDAGAAIQAGIDAISGTGGTVRLRPGRYRYDAVVPRFAPDASAWVKVLGHRATIVLAPGAPRAFDAWRSHDDDVFRLIWLEGFSIDAAAARGPNHTIFGNYINNDVSLRARAGFDNIVIRKVSAFNVFTSFTAESDARYGIGLLVAHPPGLDVPPSRISNILIEDVDIRGGNCGVMIGGSFADSAMLPNIRIDNIRIARTRHTLGRFSPGFFVSSNFHIGDLAKTGFVRVTDSVGEYAGDNGLELNNFETAIVQRNTMNDQYNMAFYVTNNHRGFDAESQVAYFANNRAAFSTSHTKAGFGRGYFFSATAGAPPIGQLLMRSNTFSFAASPAGAHALAAFGEIRALDSDGFKAAYTDLRYDASERNWHDAFIFELTAPISSLRLAHTRVDYRAEVSPAAVAGGGFLEPYLVYVSGENVDLTIDDLAVAADTVNFGAAGGGRVHVIYLGESPRMPSGFSTIRGRIERVTVERIGSDDNPIGLHFGDLLAVRDALVLADIDLLALPDPLYRIYFSPAMVGAARVICPNNIPLSSSCVFGY